MSIVLGLERVATVAAAMGLARLPFPVVAIAGTNGKGSCAVMLEALLAARGARVGSYLSPHLLRYNERVRIAGREAGDEALCAAFAAVERARSGVALTAFEFATLAAVWLLREAGVEVGVLEVGLGGRLDAVNLFDPAVAVITTIDLDHREWLGGDREAVAAEKAGILRPGRPLVCADPDPPRALLAAARERGARLLRIGAEFRYRVEADGSWAWRGPGARLERLAPPGLHGEFQYRNASAALAAAACLEPWGLPEAGAASRALAGVRLPGRIEALAGPVRCVADVAHNRQAVAALAAWLAGEPCPGRTLAVCAMLADKDPVGLVEAFAASADAWYLAGLGGPRGDDGSALAGALAGRAAAGAVHRHPDVPAACRAALAAARPGDRVVAFGSFLTARAALTVFASG